MTADLLPLLSDTDRDLHEVTADAWQVLEPVRQAWRDEDRTVDVDGDDGYDWDVQ